MQSKWYVYSQNNSGGRFEETDKLGQYTIIEAYAESHSDSIAEEIGIYFDNECYTDCSCCGSRWSSPEEFNTINDINICDLSLNDIIEGKTNLYITGATIVINYLDGYSETLKAKNNYET